MLYFLFLWSMPVFLPSHIISPGFFKHWRVMISVADFVIVLFLDVKGLLLLECCDLFLTLLNAG
jgi:uncharacterized membrane protein